MVSSLLPTVQGTRHEYEHTPPHPYSKSPEAISRPSWQMEKCGGCLDGSLVR
jgi:hypothetical protein